MKKLVVLGVILSLAVAGCAGFQNIVQGGEDKVCNAPPEVLAVADTVLSLLKPLVEGAVPGSGIVLAYATASNIKATGCASLKALDQLIDFINGFNTARAGQKALMVDPNPLVNWKIQGKK